MAALSKATNPQERVGCPSPTHDWAGRLAHMRRFVRWLGRHIGGVLSGMFTSALSAGALLYLAEKRGIHPDRWVADMLSEAFGVSVDTYVWLFIIGGSGLIGLLAWEIASRRRRDIAVSAIAAPVVKATLTDSIPISIQELRLRIICDYAGFFEGKNPDDAQRIDLGEVTIANISKDRRVALDLVLRIAGKLTNLPLQADLRGPQGLLLGKDDLYAKLARAKDLERIEYFRNPVEIEPQEVQKKRLVFLFTAGRAGFVAKPRDYTYTLEVTDHMSGKSISIPIRGSYRGEP